ncbi:MAG: DUF4838 domain-containing protein [Lentisphaeria bacterium]|nr:DUF4838 domain-containing protein [Lentisphaeria bacterium]
MLAVVSAVAAEPVLFAPVFHAVRRPGVEAVVQQVETDVGVAWRHTAPVYSLLRCDLPKISDWSKYQRLQFQYRGEQTMGIGFGYLYSIAPDGRSHRCEFSLNKALGMGGVLPGKTWLSGRLDLSPRQNFFPERVKAIDFGLTDRRATGITRETPVTFELANFALAAKGRGRVPGNPQLAGEFDGYIRHLRADPSPLEPVSIPSSGMVIVQDGQACVDIILGAGELAKSAEELQLWLQNITGATLPILRERTGGRGAILLGRVLAEPGHADDLRRLADSDGYAVRHDGANVLIFGAEPRGTLNGVYAFLENNSDIIWPRPTPEMTAVFSQSRDFLAGNCDLFSRPTFRYRGWGTNGGLNRHDEIWNSRNYCNAPGGGGGYDPGNATRVPWGNRLTYGGGHNLYLFLPGDQYFADHPEYYALINGERQYPAPMKNNPCFTNPGMLDAFVASVLARLEASPLPANADLALKVEDNWGLCECPSCLAPLELPDGTTLTLTDANFRSTQFYLWLNEVVKRVKVRHPHLQFLSYAYFFTARAPAVAVDPSVVVMFCPYVRPNDKYPLFSACNGEWYDDFANWCSVSPNMLLREYYGVGMRFPRPLAEVAAFDQRALAALGLRRITSEIAPDRQKRPGEKRDYRYQESWDSCFHEFWVITRLWWNPDQDVEGLRREFCRRAFRTAAEPMWQYYSLLRDTWYADPRPSTCGDGDVDNFRHYILGQGLEGKMRALLVEAEKRADHPVSRRLILSHLARFDAWGRQARERQAPTAAIPLVRDGDFAKGRRLDDFTVMGHPDRSPQNQTVVQIFHDATSLHIRYACFGETEPLSATSSQAPGERWPSGDHIELFLSDGADSNGYFQFAVDYLGNRCDLDNRQRMKWNGQWESRARITETGYEVDVVVPFATINWDPARPQGAALFMRGDEAKKENSSWGGGRVHQPYEFGRLSLMR